MRRGAKCAKHALRIRESGKQNTIATTITGSPRLSIRWSLTRQLVLVSAVGQTETVPPAWTWPARSPRVPRRCARALSDAARRTRRYRSE